MPGWLHIARDAFLSNGEDDSVFDDFATQLEDPAAFDVDPTLSELQALAAWLEVFDLEMLLAYAKLSSSEEDEVSELVWQIVPVDSLAGERCGGATASRSRCGDCEACYA